MVWKYLGKGLFMKKTALFTAILFFMTSGGVYAIEEVYDEPIYPQIEEGRFSAQVKRNQINTLDNYIDSLENSSISIDKFTREDIKRQNNPTLADILQQATGVVVNTNSGSEGNVSSVRMRGTDRVRMTIDGIRADRTTGIGYVPETQFINTDDLELIEVIKGPQGNVLGTNALGGAINMQTRRGRGPFKFELGSDIGQLSTFKERAAIMGEYKNLDYYFSTTYYKTAGGMRTSDLGTLRNDAYRNLFLVSNVGYKLLDGKAELRNIFRFSNAKKGLGYGYGDLWRGIPVYNDPNNYVKNMDIMENVSFKHAVNERYDYSMRFGLYQSSNYNYDMVPDNFDPYAWDWAKYKGNRINFITQHNFKLADWNRLSVGYNLEREYAHFSSQGDMGWGYNSYDLKSSTLQNDLYVNDSINIKDKLFIRGGVRYIHNNVYGDYITPNGSVALVLPTFKLSGAKTKFRGSWGQGVNNPSLYQRFVNIPSWGYIPNPELNAEVLTGWDAGVEQSFFDGKVKFDFGFFNSSYKDYIVNAQVANSWDYQYQNIDNAKIFGYESKLTVAPNDYVKLVLNYTYTDSEDKATGLELPQAPNNTYGAMLYLTPLKERWDLYAGVVATSSRRVTAGDDPDNRVDGVLDARLGTKVRLFSIKGVHVYLRGDIFNLFDQDNCVYRQGNVFYYSPAIRSRFGIFVEYDTEKQKMLDEQKLVRSKLKEEKKMQKNEKIKNL